MTLSAGTKLGSYQILSAIGAGGMGEVYRARDTKLGRDVAIKFLRGLASNAERMARFEREARLLASLNHPNIATLYGLEEADGTPFLVMELVEGETLAERIARGAIPLAEALPLFEQIAEGLEAAHEKGIVHRDLKPANINITPAEKIKVLDFGLAKALGVGLAQSDQSTSPTITRDATATGVIMGTAAYMSPDQARGKAVDQCADIWAFGCVLYEALTSRAPFLGTTASDTIAKILEREPDWTILPAGTPPKIFELLRRCLNKDAHNRLQHMGDARIQIAEAAADPTTSTGVSAPARSRATSSLILAFAAAVASGLSVWGVMRSAPPELPRPVSRFTLEPTGVPVERQDLALSPDGSRLVHVGERSGARQLFFREMETGVSVPIPGSEGASRPFFSPDGEWVGYYDYAMAKIRRVSLRGGAPVSITDAGSPTGTSWGPDGTLFYAPSYSTPLWRVPVDGGSPEPLTELNVDPMEMSHRWPEVLPGGKALLFTVIDSDMSSSDEANIEALLLETGERRVVLEGGSHPKYVPTGHLLYAQSGAVFAVPFDLERLEVFGSSTKVVDGLQDNAEAVELAVSTQGTLAYATGESTRPSLTWVDREGHESPLSLEPSRITTVRISPDGRFVAMQIARLFSQLWIHDLTRETTSRPHPTWEAILPIWSPDGTRVVFSSSPGGQFGLFWHRADGSGETERLAESEFQLLPTSFSPDGRTLAYLELHAETNLDIWTLPMDGDRAPKPLLRTPSIEGAAEFSPDGNWLAYVSDETGRLEVYVTSYRDGGKWQISTQGGSSPSWSKTRGELYYHEGNRMMAVSITTGASLSAEKPRLLFEKADWDEGMPDTARYGLAPDGRFLILQGSPAEPATIHVVLNWFEELKRLTATTN